MENMVAPAEGEPVEQRTQHDAQQCSGECRKEAPRAYGHHRLIDFRIVTLKSLRQIPHGTCADAEVG